MDYKILGRTGLKVSVAGLGCGGPSRLGLAGLKNQTHPESEVVAHVRGAIDLGINFFDTAEWYGTEGVVGKAIAGVPRDRLVISTKKNIVPENHSDPDSEIRRALEQSLKNLRTDYVDVYHVHGAEPKDYRNAVERHLPTLLRLREEGKIRAVGITERFVVDSSHQMAERAVRDNVWDVVMVGFNLLNPCARENIFPLTAANGVGVLVSYALRRALSQPERLKKLIVELVATGAIPAEAVNLAEPLDFVIHSGAADSIQDAAYRFCRHEPGVDVVLTGTGNPQHLKANVESVCRPPLPAFVQSRLKELFGSIGGLTGNQ